MLLKCLGCAVKGWWALQTPHGSMHIVFSKFHYQSWHAKKKKKKKGQSNDVLSCKWSSRPSQLWYLLNLDSIVNEFWAYNPISSSVNRLIEWLCCEGVIMITMHDMRHYTLPLPHIHLTVGSTQELSHSISNFHESLF